MKLSEIQLGVTVTIKFPDASFMHVLIILPTQILRKIGKISTFGPWRLHVKSFYPGDKGFMSFIYLLPGMHYRCDVHHEVHHEVHNVILKFPAQI